MKTTALILLAALLAALLTGCVSTKLVYNPNVYQSGRAAGQGQFKIHTGITAASAIVSRDITDATGVRDSIETHWGGNTTSNNDQYGADFMGSFSYGLSNRVDLGASLSFASFGTASFRPYVKVMVTDSASRFAFSIMPAVALVSGSKDSETLFDNGSGGTEEIRSHLTAFELHFPTSLQASPAFQWTFTPRVAWLTYTASYEYATGSGSTVPSFKIENEENVTAFGASIGFLWKGLQPEISFLASEEHFPLFAFGIGAHP